MALHNRVTDCDRFPASAQEPISLTHLTHGLGVARRLKTGIVHVNDQSVADEPQAPFGGFRSSGYGRFGGRWGIEAFSNIRWITLACQHVRYPF
ncbi:Aldehyde dehydrogenase family protein [Nonomuraea solani]|uniref:Aldehyde dehydrogenase family protein n=1 Tax=Nonomuraea solani TaxID=1144553 RepID=A0A1H6EFN4_9ACTN|nr:aldehyde dehydrogenase family protein [Nonomuraea solani]SEG96101.1 Aldehyde dehydrogenase family protein [Nonomuraea solani]